VDARMGPPPGEGRAGGGKGSRRKAQFAMDVDVPEEVPPERVVDVVDPDEDDEEEEADFPEIALDELLEGFDELTLGPPEEEVIDV